MTATLILFAIAAAFVAAVVGLCALACREPARRCALCDQRLGSIEAAVCLDCLEAERAREKGGRA